MPAAVCREEGTSIRYAELTQMAAAAPTPLRGGDRSGSQAVRLARRDAGEDRGVLQNHQAAPPTIAGEFVRDCLDSLALTYRKTLEGLEDVLGRKIDVIHIVGGGRRTSCSTR